MKDEITRLLASLVAIQSVEGRAVDKQESVDFVRQWLSAKGVQTTDHPHPDCPSIIADIQGSGDPILLLAHLDVVPAPDELFTMRREGDRVFGRGVIDDKGSVAILLLLLAELSTWTTRPAIKAVFTTDEEIGSHIGVLGLLESEKFGTISGVIALDGGSEDAVVTKEKGMTHILLQAIGKEAHNSQPWLGDNAVEKILRVYERIKQACAINASADGHWHETVSIGRMDGGKFVNQVPAYAEAKIDIRFTELYTVATMRTLIDSCLEEGVRVVQLGSGECFETDATHPLVQTYISAMRAQGMDMKTVHEHGATDARFFAHLGVPILIHDPLGGGFHSDDEWMDLASAERVYNGLVEFFRHAIQ